MCGLTGFFKLDKYSEFTASREELTAMTNSLEHRGPDSVGMLFEKNIGLGFGHRRLAIRDLSSQGAQPMSSSCGRFTLIYNGEIYTHIEIRNELLKGGQIVRGQSDTAVILEAFSKWGITSTLEKLNGMFAIAVFDRKEHRLTLIRDRLGIKPLYWGKTNGYLVFGSELKSFHHFKQWKPVLDRNSLASYMRHNYIGAPHTIFKGMSKLEAGSILEVRLGGKIKTSRYWNLKEVAEKNIKTRDISCKDHLERIESLISDSVRRRLVSDVPVGSLLSGGIDSSLVTALMAENSKTKVKTFSVGFTDRGFNEAPFAREIANYLDTDHNEIYAGPNDALNLVNALPEMYDEPFSDSSQIPTALIFALTRKHVSVVLSGDGGDELFGGYNRYLMAQKLEAGMNFLPYSGKKLIAQALNTLPEKFLDLLGHSAPGRLKINQLGHKIKKLSRATSTNYVDDMYRSMLTHWEEPSKIVLLSKEYKGLIWDNTFKDKFPDFLDRMQLLDSLTYLPDDILTKVDRASMAVGLEARVPLLDYRLVEAAWGLPKEMKIHKGISKKILREILYKKVPKKLLDRPKMGFGIPLAEWLRGPLRDWTESLLNQREMLQQGIFDVQEIQQRWRRHLAGENWAYLIWDVLMFQAWLNHQEKKYGWKPS